jgi:hypothetical protein
MIRRLPAIFSTLSLLLAIAFATLAVRSSNSSEEFLYINPNADKSWPCKIPPSNPILPTTGAWALTSVVSIHGKLWLIHSRLVTFDSPAAISLLLPNTSGMHWYRPAAFGSPTVIFNARNWTTTTLGVSTFDFEGGNYVNDAYHDIFWERDRGLGFPTWWLILLFSLPLIYTITKSLRHRIKPGLCLTCGYDLRATPQGRRCPECGTISSHITNHTH